MVFLGGDLVLNTDATGVLPIRERLHHCTFIGKVLLTILANQLFDALPVRNRLGRVDLTLLKIEVNQREFHLAVRTATEEAESQMGGPGFRADLVDTVQVDALTELGVSAPRTLQPLEDASFGGEGQALDLEIGFHGVVFLLKRKVKFEREVTAGVRSRTSFLISIVVVGPTGFEPATFGFRDRALPTELRSRLDSSRTWVLQQGRILKG